ncbi:Retrovirus-related Pol polyprotein from type-2 retrotransposable element R2DM [Chlorella vulgaris]
MAQRALAAARHVVSVTPKVKSQVARQAWRHHLSLLLFLSVCALLAPVSGPSSPTLSPCGVHQPHGKHTCLLGTLSSILMPPPPLSSIRRNLISARVCGSIRWRPRMAQRALAAARHVVSVTPKVKSQVARQAWRHHLSLLLFLSVCALLAPVSGPSSPTLSPCGVHQPHGKHTCLLGTLSSILMPPPPLSSIRRNLISARVCGSIRWRPRMAQRALAAARHVASWQAHLPPGHPFIYFDAAAATFKVALPAAAAPPIQARQAGTLAVLLPRLGWAHPALPAPLLLSSLTVRHGTSLLTSPTATRRAAQYFTPFGLLADAAAPAPAAVVQAVLARLWRVRWENCHKEAFWRLVCDAVPTASRLHMDQPCQCGGAPADRRHYFWTCPVARGVVDSIAGELTARQLLPAPLAAAHIWLAAAPAGVHGGVWDVVSLAAVAAMDHGRRRMYAMSLAPPPLPPLVPVCLRSARARFWTLLTDFVALRCAPASWQAHLPPGHPFIYFDAAAATFKGRLFALVPFESLPFPSCSCPCLMRFGDGRAACCVRTADGCTDMFQTQLGLKQGCPLSPNLFGLYVDDLPAAVAANAAADLPRLGDGSAVFSLMYADDLTCLAASPSGLQHHMNKLDSYAATWGLAINVQKTKMVVSHGQRRRTATPPDAAVPLTTSGATIEAVDEFRYLGIHFHGSLAFATAATARAAAANWAMHAMRCRCAELGLQGAKLQMQMFNTMSTPALVLLAETGQRPLMARWAAQLGRFWNTVLAADETTLVMRALRQVAAALHAYGVDVDLHRPQPVTVACITNNAATLFRQQLSSAQGTRIRAYNDATGPAAADGMPGYLAALQHRAKWRVPAQLRTGSHWLAEETGQWQQPRAERSCSCCAAAGEQHVEDVKHAVLMCPRAEQLRDRYPSLFTQAHTHSVHSFVSRPEPHLGRTQQAAVDTAQGAALSLAGQPLEAVSSFKYLGITFHASSCIAGAAAPARAVAARAAMHSCNARCAALGVEAAPLQLRLFSTMVDAVLSYGSEAERLHLAHLRRLLGVRQGTPTAVVLAEAGERPLWQRWVLRAVKLWNLAVTAEQSSLLWQAMTASVALAVAPGHRIPARQPWAQQLAAALAAMGVQLDLHQHLPVCQAAVQSACSAWQLKQLQDAATREGASKLQHYTQGVWGGTLDAASLGTRAAYLTVVRERGWAPLAQLRTGSHWGAEETGRWDKTPPEQQLCSHCGGGVETVQHIIFDCPLYAGLRTRFSDLFCLLPEPRTLHAFFQQPPARLATFAASLKLQWQVAHDAAVLL